MSNTTIMRLIYNLKHRVFTMNNLVVFIALLVAVSWSWGAVGVMQRNFTQQKVLDDKIRQQKLAALEVENLKYQKRYYESAEYQELSAREHLGLAAPGEKVLILPANTPEAKQVDEKLKPKANLSKVTPTNATQWTNFLLGGNAAGLQD